MRNRTGLAALALVLLPGCGLGGESDKDPADEGTERAPGGVLEANFDIVCYDAAAFVRDRDSGAIESTPQWDWRCPRG